MIVTQVSLTIRLVMERCGEFATLRANFDATSWLLHATNGKVASSNDVVV